MGSTDKSQLAASRLAATIASSEISTSSPRKVVRSIVSSIMRATALLSIQSPPMGTHRKTPVSWPETGV